MAEAYHSLATVLNFWKWARSWSHVGRNDQVFQLLSGSRSSHFLFTAPPLCLLVHPNQEVPSQLQHWTQYLLHLTWPSM